MDDDPPGGTRRTMCRSRFGIGSSRTLSVKTNVGEPPGGWRAARERTGSRLERVSFDGGLYWSGIEPESRRDESEWRWPLWERASEMSFSFRAELSAKHAWM